MQNILNLVNVYSPNDELQTSGSGMSVFAAGRQLPEDEGAVNVSAPEATSHTDLWQNLDVWQKEVVPHLDLPSGSQNSQMGEDAKRQCTLGNRAACD